MNVAYEQEFELYHYGDSIASQMARLALAEKKIPYKSHHLHLESNGDHMTAAYRKVNPRSLVPTLVHEGEPRYDSYKIMRYLDDLAPEQGASLWPREPDKMAQLEQLVEQYALKEEHGLGDNFGSSVGGASAHILIYLLKQRSWWAIVKEYLGHPVRKRGLIFIMIRTLGKVPGALYTKCINGVAEGLTEVERRLAHGGDYLLEEYSAADLMLSVHFSRLDEVALGDILDWDKLPRIQAYWQRLKQRPGFTEAIANWHKSDWYDAMAAVYDGQANPYLPALRKEIERQLES